MKGWDRFRKWFYRKTLPTEFKHLKRLHPDFKLKRLGNLEDNYYEIFWKQKLVGVTNPLSNLTKPQSERCFIVATGPSLNEIDFKQLANETLLGVNGAVAKCNKNVFMQYHFISDASFVLTRLSFVEKMINSGADCLFSFATLNNICECKPELLEAKNVFLLPEMNLQYDVPKKNAAEFDLWAESEPEIILHDNSRLMNGRVGFSKNINQGVFTAQTVVFEAVQTAAYLGFKKINILGMDLNFSQDTSRFYEHKKDVVKSRINRDFEPYVLPAFEVAGKVAKHEGFEIFNLSPDSRLPATIIKKISFEDALQ